MATHEVYLDEIEMGLSVEKIKTHVKEEGIEFENIRGTLNAINSGYKTENTGLLVNIKTELGNKGKIVQKIHHDNVDVLNIRIQKHLDFVKKESKILKQAEDVTVI